MGRWRESWRRLRNHLRAEEVERGLADDVAFHLERQTAENLRRGMTPSEARREAHLAFGSIEAHKEAARDEVRLRWLEDLGKDLRFGLRMLARAPVFTAVAEARSRLETHGANRLTGTKKESGFRAFLRQYEDFMQIVLLAAAVINLLVTQDVGTSLVLAGLTVFNAVVGLRQRLRHFRAQRIGIHGGSGGEVRHGNGDVVEATDHEAGSLLAFLAVQYGGETALRQGGGKSQYCRGLPYGIRTIWTWQTGLRPVRLRR